MGSVLNRDSLEYRRFVDVENFVDPPWLADPVFEPPELSGQPQTDWRIDPDDVVREKTAGEKYNDRSAERAASGEQRTVSTLTRTRVAGQKVWRIPMLNGNRQILRRGLREVTLAAVVRAIETNQRTEIPPTRINRGRILALAELNDFADVVNIVLDTDGTLSIYRENGILNYDVTLRWAGIFGQTALGTRQTSLEVFNNASTRQNPVHAGSAAGNDGFREASGPHGRSG